MASAKLTVGLASSALFQLDESDRVFRERGKAAYLSYQREHLDDTLRPGVAFAFAERLLSLNEVPGVEVDVVVLSRNSPETGLRVMRSIEAHGLPISRAVFSEGRSPYGYMDALGMSLFLSANGDDVARAIEEGRPAGQVLHGTLDDEGDELRVAFDFDGVLADDSAEQVFADEGLVGFQNHERELAQVAHERGPLAAFLAGLNEIQRAEDELTEQDAGYRRRLRVSIVTARSAPAHERALASLRAWGLRVDDAFFLGGLPKPPVLNVLRPHLFFDDQLSHLPADALRTPAVHVPFGVRNAQSLSTEVVPGRVLRGKPFPSRRSTTGC